uniref:BTB domain-containing protein n=1 Tax=Mycena chlorophos TaxID=658473 RepID=A0ABQ0LY56_MYCCL|nr:predicted protein [Mycena chlorophos]
MEVDNAPRANGPHRIAELWFSDGNVVLQAGTAFYKLHQSILGMHSPIFKDMFEIPQPQDGETMDGCPLVRLPDAEVEVTPFLRALLDPQFFPPHPSTTDFATIYGCLHLGHKYEVAFLRQRGLHHLGSKFRMHLDYFDQQLHDPEDEERLAINNTSWEDPEDPSYLLCAISLAREVDAPWLLPCMFYVLSTKFNDLGSRIFHGSTCGAIPAQLSRADQELVVRGCEATTLATHNIVQRVVTKFLYDVAECQDANRCAPVRLIIVNNLRAELGSKAALAQMSYTGYYGGMTLCGVCRKTVEREHETARKGFWDQLPKIYELGDWDNLFTLRDQSAL